MIGTTTPAGQLADGVPAIVSSRFGVDGAHTIDGYRNSGSYTGYQAIRSVLEMAPDAVTATVRDATLLLRRTA